MGHFIKERQQINNLVYSYTKVYPTFLKHIVYDYPRLVQQKGYEPLIENKIKNKKISESTPQTKIESLRRSRTVISDLVLCNQFDQFATFTFKKDRQNIQKCKEKMSYWLKSQQKQYGKFKYLIVPEFHKDGKSLHFHALMSGYKGRLVPAHTRINNRQVFNIRSYNYGFSTLVTIDDVAKVSSYVRKYITKDMPIFMGKKRYWCSTGLLRPRIYENLQLENNPFIELEQTYNEKGFTIYKSTATIKLLSNITEGNSWKQSTLATWDSWKKSKYNTQFQNEQVTHTQCSLLNLHSVPIHLKRCSKQNRPKSFECTARTLVHRQATF